MYITCYFDDDIIFNKLAYENILTPTPSEFSELPEDIKTKILSKRDVLEALHENVYVAFVILNNNDEVNQVVCSICSMDEFNVKKHRFDEGASDELYIHWPLKEWMAQLV